VFIILNALIVKFVNNYYLIIDAKIKPFFETKKFLVKKCENVFGLKKFGLGLQKTS